MSVLEVHHGQFPDVISEDARVGDMVTFTVTGRISRMEDELIDVTPPGGPFVYLPGHRTSRIAITEIRKP